VNTSLDVSSVETAFEGLTIGLGCLRTAGRSLAR
jgi:hypothetical protein